MFIAAGSYICGPNLDPFIRVAIPAADPPDNLKLRTVSPEAKHRADKVIILMTAEAQPAPPRDSSPLAVADTSRARPDVIVGLDLVRFATALLVVVYHFAHRAWAPPIASASIRQFIPNSPAFPELEPFTWMGWVGVEIFFVISGYVIANSAERSSPFAFLRSRVVRLAPAIWICASITFAVYCMVKGVDGGVLKRYVRAVATPAFPYGPWVDSVYWTLVVEITFYVLVFFLLAGDKFRRLEWLMVMLSLVSGGLWVVWALTGLGDPVLTSKLGQVLLVRHGCFFAVGIALWLLTSKRVTVLRLTMLVLALTGSLFEISQLSRAKFDVIGRELPIFSAQAVFLTGVAAIYASVRFNGHLTQLVRGAAGITRSLGLMTYPLYLIHNVVGVALLNGLVVIGIARFPALSLAVLGMIALAWSISRTGEPWLAGMLKRLFGSVERTISAAPRASRLLKPTTPVPG